LTEKLEVFIFHIDVNSLTKKIHGSSIKLALKQVGLIITQWV